MTVARKYLRYAEIRAPSRPPPGLRNRARSCETSPRLTWSFALTAPPQGGDSAVASRGIIGDAGFRSRESLWCGRGRDGGTSRRIERPEFVAAVARRARSGEALAREADHCASRTDQREAGLYSHWCAHLLHAAADRGLS
jgi:hypothetical protein